MDTDRRAVVTGLAATMVLAGRAVAASPAPVRTSLFSGTSLAANRVAALFSRVDLPLPNVAVLTVAGQRRLTQLVGNPRLLTLWAEWCVPCLVEARDLASLQPKVVNDHFDIVSVLTGSIGKLDYADAAQRLQKAGAAGLTLLVEPAGGSAILKALDASPPVQSGQPPSLPPRARDDGFALPCTLLVDRDGRVRGRATGATFVTVVSTGQKVGQPLTDQQKQGMLGTSNKTIWSTPAALTFLTALREGALDAAMSA